MHARRGRRPRPKTLSRHALASKRCQEAAHAPVSTETVHAMLRSVTLPPIDIDADIRRARTLPAEVYADPEWFEVQRDRVFARTWHVVGDANDLDQQGDVRP